MTDKDVRLELSRRQGQHRNQRLQVPPGMNEPWNDVGRVLAGRYRLLGPIGRGGMGTVWQAVDEFLGRDVAVKQVLIPAGIPDDDRVEIYARSLREARIAARLRHPSLITIYDVLTDAGGPQIVMELVRSPSLQDLVVAEGPLQPGRVAEIGLALLAGLRVAHAAGVMHRDVKPSNVLVGTDGGVVLTDFGIARREGDPRMTLTGQLIGSPGYIAPELLRGSARASPASDLWSLGATLYFAVEGRPPYQEDSIPALLAAATTADPVSMRSAGALAPVIRGLMERDPAARLSSEQAEGLLRDVRDQSAGEVQRGPVAISGAASPSAGTVPLDQYAVARSRRGGGPRVLAALMAGLAMVAGAIWAVASFTRDDGPPASETPAAETLTYVDGEHGFSLAVPTGWGKSTGSNDVRFTRSGSGMRPDMFISWEPDNRTTAITQVANADDRIVRKVMNRPGYKRQRLESVDVAGQDAAELEYSWLPSPPDGDGRRLHVLGRCIVTWRGTYWIYWRAPENQWVGIEPLRRKVLASFRPVQ